MDVAGAKALQRRLDPARVVQAARSAVDVREDAPPVFHWFGVDRVTDDALPAAAEDAPTTRASSWLRRLGLGPR